MAKQLVLRGNRVLSHGEDCFLCAGGAVICPETGRTFENATVVNHPGEIPSDIDEVGYEYHAGAFVPCAPFGKGGGNIAVVCNEDCKSIKDSGINAEHTRAVSLNGVVLKNTPMTGYEVSDNVFTIVEQNGVYLASHRSTGTQDVRRSTDGKTWEKVELPFSGRARIAAGNGVFVASYPSSSIGFTSTSTDGIEWTAISNTTDGDLLAGGDGLFAMGRMYNNNTAGYRSTDGKTWSRFTTSYMSNVAAAAYGNNAVLFMSSGGGGNNDYYGFSYVVTEDNVIRIGSPSDSGYCSVAYGNGRFVALSTAGKAAILKDEDIADSGSFQTSTTVFGTVASNSVNIVFDNEVFVALDGTKTNAAYSPDGETWTRVSIPNSSNVWSSLKYYNGVFQLASSTGIIAESSDYGKTWKIGGWRLYLPNGIDVTDEVKTALEI